MNTVKKNQNKPKIKRTTLHGLMFVSPWILGTLLFFAFPLIYSLVLSFCELKNGRIFSFDFQGLKFYKDAFLSDVKFTPNFLESIQTVLINTPLINLFALGISLLLNSKIRCRGFFRAIFFLPVMLGTGFIMQQLVGLDVQQETVKLARGILLPDTIMQYLGPVVSNYIGIFLDRITIVLWGSGVQILIYLTGLQSVSSTLYEAAQVDSATKWESFWLITLPILAPTILINLVYTVIDTYTSSTNKVIDYILELAFERSKFELSAAMGWVYFFACLLFVGLLFLIMNRFVKQVTEDAQ